MSSEKKRTYSSSERPKNEIAGKFNFRRTGRWGSQEGHG